MKADTYRLIYWQGGHSYGRWQYILETFPSYQAAMAYGEAELKGLKFYAKTEKELSIVGLPVGYDASNPAEYWWHLPNGFTMLDMRERN